MNIQDRVELGRKCAYGIGQMVDLEKAYAMWNGLESLLSAEEKEVLDWIKQIIDETEIQQYSPVVSSVASYAMPINSIRSYTMDIAHHTDRHTEAEVIDKFNALLAEAKKSGTLDSLYSALERYGKDKTSKKEKKPENIRLGNNIGYLASYFWTSTDGFFRALNEARKARGLKENKSIQGLYQVIGGVNGMKGEDKMIIIDMANRIAPTKRTKGLTRALEIQDLQLPFSEFIILFSPPALDDKSRRLLAFEKNFEH